MMEAHVLSNIHCELDVEKLRKRLHLRVGSQDELDLNILLGEARQIANPKAFYRAAKVEKSDNDEVMLAGIRFSSRVLTVNLAKAEIVYPFVATCGRELYEWARAIDDMVWMYWADAIMEEALMWAINAMHKEIVNMVQTGHMTTMSPGSLENWPISEQKPLFMLLGEPEKEIGVALTESMLMIPAKSVSGIVFPAEASFESCMLCQRENCPNRRTPYDETLYEREYCPAGGK